MFSEGSEVNMRKKWVKPIQKQYWQVFSILVDMKNSVRQFQIRGVTS